MSGKNKPAHDETSAPEPKPGLAARLYRLVVGRPRGLTDRNVFTHFSLIALLARIGRGADGLSSSSYGPDEAFRTLGPHTYLALAFAGMTAFTVVLIAAGCCRIIEEFPHGGGG